jgi:hypothetical protein
MRPLVLDQLTRQPWLSVASAFDSFRQQRIVGLDTRQLVSAALGGIESSSVGRRQAKRKCDSDASPWGWST